MTGYGYEHRRKKNDMELKSARREWIVEEDIYSSKYDA
jgi:hypothetical protein